MSIISRASNQDSPPCPWTWRGHGGVVPTLSNVEFDKQLDQLSLWVEVWNHKQRCEILEDLLTASNYNQFQFLWTVMQPTLHRDFMYEAKNIFPSINFQPISTHISRKVKERTHTNRQDNYHRIDSAYLRDSRQVKQECRVEQAGSAHCGLPHLPLNKNRNSTTKTKSKESFDWDTVASAPALYRFIEMPVRRHMQKQSQSTEKPASAERIVSVNRRSHPLTRSKSMSPVPHPNDLPKEARQLLDWYSKQWSDVQRNEFLHKLLLKLDARQYYFISTFLMVKNYKDFITCLPETLALEILSYLTPKELLTACRVSKAWKKMCYSGSLWMKHCLRLHSKIKPPAVGKPNWKKVYKENLHLKKNWNTGQYKTVNFQGHSHKVLTVTIDGKHLASGSMDKTIRIWDIRNGRLLHTLKGHAKGVWCLQFFTTSLLISGSYDGTIKVWNLRTCSTARTLFGHDGPVWTITRRGNILVSGSQDKTAKVWDINRCLLLFTLTGHSAAVFAVDLNENGSVVLTGSADRTVRLWEGDTGHCIKVIWASPSTSIVSLSCCKGFFACSYGETILLYKIDGARHVKTFNDHQKRIEAIQLKISDPEKGEGQMVSAGQDGTVKYWNIQESKSIQTFICHKGEPVNCIAFDETRIATASSDNKIKVMNFNV